MSDDAVEIVVLGAINHDEVARVLHHPAPGETVITSELAVHQGGKAANQAYAAATAGLHVRVQMIAAVGDDGAGRAALRSLASVGVETALVRTVVGVPTGRAHITVSRSGENAIVVALGANAFVSPSSLPETFAAAVAVAQTEIGAAAVDALARLAAASGARLVLNDGPVVPLDAATLSAADPIIVNEHEAAEVAGRTATPEELARAVRRTTNARSVIVTLGSQGSVIDDSEGTRLVPAAIVEEVVDTTGAGDVFVGTFAAAVAAGQPNDEAVAMAASAAAASVQHHGARMPLHSQTPPISA